MNSLCVTVLTGHRPRLLQRTLGALVRQVPSLLEEAHVLVMVNGPDDATMSAVNAVEHIDDIHVHDASSVLPIGSAVSQLMRRVPADVRYVLHLEDDWECNAADWLDRAKWLLDNDARVGQIRLRRHVSASVPSQAVSRYHLVTGRIIKWTDRRAPEGWPYRTGNGHFTFNPSLVRRDLLGVLYPCEGERDAAAKFHGTGLLSAQLVPGAFRHIGGEDSLRERLGRVT